MDYFGWIVEVLSDVWADVHQSPYAHEAKALLNLIDKAIFAAATLERAHNEAATLARPKDSAAKRAKVVALRPAAKAQTSAALIAAE